MAVEGDLVLVKGGKPLTAWETRPDYANKKKSNENASLYSGGPSGDSSGAAAGKGVRGARGGARDGRQQQGGGRGRGGRGREGGGQEEVVRVTAEAARAGVFTIKHVVLPLPGVSCIVLCCTVLYCADYMHVLAHPAFDTISRAPTATCRLVLFSFGSCAFCLFVSPLLLRMFGFYLLRSPL